MIKTLRITSIVTAVFAIAFFAFIVIVGDRKDDSIQEFLNSPGVREKFEKDENNRLQVSGDRVSPLVKQAESFALFLNPPKEKMPKNGSLNKYNRLVSAPVKPKFTVHATSYCEYNPEISLALIDEPGKGRHWIRQSDKIGHLIIEQVKDGLVIVKNDEETFEVPIKETSAKALDKGSSAVSGSSTTKKPAKTNLSVSERDVRSLIKSKLPKLNQTKYEDTEKDAKDELVRRLKNVQRTLEYDGNSVETDDEKAERMDELISKFKSSRITDEEAEKLDDLGEQLKDVQKEPNEIESKTKSDKLGTGKLIPK